MRCPIDVVVCNEVLEHLRINPIFTFREINRVLRPRGTLLLSTPNLTSLEGWWDLAVRGQPANDLYRVFGKLDTLGHVGHVRLYTPAEVAAFLEKMGFAVHTICHREGAARPSRWVGKLATGIPRLFPRLRTHFSVVASKSSKVAEKAAKDDAIEQGAALTP